MNNEELKARIAELEEKNAAYDARLRELAGTIEDYKNSYKFLNEQNDKLTKALESVKNIVEIVIR